jgi:hypothetical protein
VFGGILTKGLFRAVTYVEILHPVLYCTVLYCTVLYCTALYCTVLYCTVLYCTVLYCTVLYCTVLLQSFNIPKTKNPVMSKKNLSMKTTFSVAFLKKMALLFQLHKAKCYFRVNVVRHSYKLCVTKTDII